MLQTHWGINIKQSFWKDGFNYCKTLPVSTLLFLSLRKSLLHFISSPTPLTSTQIWKTHILYHYCNFNKATGKSSSCRHIQPFQIYFKSTTVIFRYELSEVASSTIFSIFWMHWILIRISLDTLSISLTHNFIKNTV